MISFRLILTLFLPYPKPATFQFFGQIFLTGEGLRHEIILFEGESNSGISQFFEQLAPVITWDILNYPL